MSTNKNTRPNWGKIQILMTLQPKPQTINLIPKNMQFKSSINEFHVLYVRNLSQNSQFCTHHLQIGVPLKGFHTVGHSNGIRPMRLLSEREIGLGAD